MVFVLFRGPLWTVASLSPQSSGPQSALGYLGSPFWLSGGGFLTSASPSFAGMERGTLERIQLSARDAEGEDTYNPVLAERLIRIMSYAAQPGRQRSPREATFAREPGGSGHRRRRAACHAAGEKRTSVPARRFLPSSVSFPPPPFLQMARSAWRPWSWAACC